MITHKHEIALPEQHRNDVFTNNDKFEEVVKDSSIPSVDRPAIRGLSAESTALLIIDVQPEYWTHCPEVRRDFPNFPRNLERTIHTCRSRGVKIIWVRADYRYNCSPWLLEFERIRGEDNAGQIPFNAASPSEVDWEDFAKPTDQELVIPKHSFSAATKTAVVDILKAFNIHTVLVCGLITSVCVHHSCYSLFDAGFRAILVQDACADRCIERHRAVIKLYGDYMYNVISSRDIKFQDSGTVLEKTQWNTARTLGGLNNLPPNAEGADEGDSWSRNTSRTASVESLSSLVDIPATVSRH
jgi:nicotinamidase-related amidase